MTEITRRMTDMTLPEVNAVKAFAQWLVDNEYIDSTALALAKVYLGETKKTGP